jgi:hypothetical protein
VCVCLRVLLFEEIRVPVPCTITDIFNDEYSSYGILIMIT